MSRRTTKVPAHGQTLLPGEVMEPELGFRLEHGGGKAPAMRMRLPSTKPPPSTPELVFEAPLEGSPSISRQVPCLPTRRDIVEILDMSADTPLLLKTRNRSVVPLSKAVIGTLKEFSPGDRKATKVGLELPEAVSASRTASSLPSTKRTPSCDTLSPEPTLRRGKARRYTERFLSLEPMMRKVTTIHSVEGSSSQEPASRTVTARRTAEQISSPRPVIERAVTRQPLGWISSPEQMVRRVTTREPTRQISPSEPVIPRIGTRKPREDVLFSEPLACGGTTRKPRLDVLSPESDVPGVGTSKPTDRGLSPEPTAKRSLAGLYSETAVSPEGIINPMITPQYNEPMRGMSALASPLSETEPRRETLRDQSIQSEQSYSPELGPSSVLSVSSSSVSLQQPLTMLIRQGTALFESEDIEPVPQHKATEEGQPTKLRRGLTVLKKETSARLTRRSNDAKGFATVELAPPHFQREPTLPMKSLPSSMVPTNQPMNCRSQPSLSRRVAMKRAIRLPTERKYDINDITVPMSRQSSKWRTEPDEQSASDEPPEHDFALAVGGTATSRRTEPLLERELLPVEPIEKDSGHIDPLVNQATARQMVEPLIIEDAVSPVPPRAPIRQTIQIASSDEAVAGSESASKCSEATSLQDQAIVHKMPIEVASEPAELSRSPHIMTERREPLEEVLPREWVTKNEFPQKSSRGSTRSRVTSSRSSTIGIGAPEERVLHIQAEPDFMQSPRETTADIDEAPQTPLEKRTTAPLLRALTVADEKARRLSAAAPGIVAPPVQDIPREVQATTPSSKPPKARRVGHVPPEEQRPPAPAYPLRDTPSWVRPDTYTPPPKLKASPVKAKGKRSIFRLGGGKKEVPLLVSRVRGEPLKEHGVQQVPHVAPASEQLRPFRVEAPGPVPRTSWAAQQRPRSSITNRPKQVYTRECIKQTPGLNIEPRGLRPGQGVAPVRRDKNVQQEAPQGPGRRDVSLQPEATPTTHTLLDEQPYAGPEYSPVTKLTRAPFVTKRRNPFVINLKRTRFFMTKKMSLLRMKRHRLFVGRRLTRNPLAQHRFRKKRAGQDSTSKTSQPPLESGDKVHDREGDCQHEETCRQVYPRKQGKECQKDLGLPVLKPHRQKTEPTSDHIERPSTSLNGLPQNRVSHLKERSHSQKRDRPHREREREGVERLEKRIPRKPLPTQLDESRNQDMMLRHRSHGQ